MAILAYDGSANNPATPLPPPYISCVNLSIKILNTGSKKGGKIPRN
jgi:hypothetical protein